MDRDKFQKNVLKEIATIKVSIDVMEDAVDCLIGKVDQMLSALRDDESAGDDWKPEGWKPEE